MEHQGLGREGFRAVVAAGEPAEVLEPCSVCSGSVSLKGVLCSGSLILHDLGMHHL